jgi:hypothetical protein
MKHVKSTDPRKKGFVTLMKKRIGADKVTCLMEDDWTLRGRCHIYSGNRNYKYVGEWAITKDASTCAFKRMEKKDPWERVVITPNFQLSLG